MFNVPSYIGTSTVRFVLLLWKKALKVINDHLNLSNYPFHLSCILFMENMINTFISEKKIVHYFWSIINSALMEIMKPELNLILWEIDHALWTKLNHTNGFTTWTLWILKIGRTVSFQDIWVLTQIIIYEDA